jgi:hypothetical protein
MGKVDAFLENLKNYAKEDIQPEVYKAVQVSKSLVGQPI